VVTSKRLGLTQVGNQPFEYPDGTPLVVDRDLQGKTRNAKNSMLGPNSTLGKGLMMLKAQRK
jgi:hypothetical protein